MYPIFYKENRRKNYISQYNAYHIILSGENPEINKKKKSGVTLLSKQFIEYFAFKYRVI